MRARALRASPIPADAARTAAAALADAAAWTVSASVRARDTVVARVFAAIRASSANISAALPLATLYSAWPERETKEQPLYQPEPYAEQN